MQFHQCCRDSQLRNPGLFALLLSVAFLASACDPGGGAPEMASDESRVLPLSEPPVARVEAETLEIHGDVRTDEYLWLRDRENAEVIAYLEAENAYTESATAHTSDLQEALYEEIVGRIKQDDSSVPYREGSYWYYTRYEEGSDYPIYCRKRGSLDAPEEIMLDGNERAEGHEFYSIGTVSVSSGEDILAFAEDVVGRRLYTIFFKDLTTGETGDVTIANVTGNVAWANDNRTLFYSRQNPETLRWYAIFRHELGGDEEDVLVYEEPDEEFYTFVFKSKSKDFLFIGSDQTLSSEYRFLDANDPTGAFQIIQPREENHEYSVEHFGNYFYFRTNLDATNFRLMRAPIPFPDRTHWQDVIPHREDVYLGGFEIFRDHLVLSERSGGLVKLRVRTWDGSDDRYVDFGEPAYSAYIGTNPEFDTTTLRYGYTSMTTPPSTFDYDMTTRRTTLMKEQEVLRGFDKNDYITERLHAEARDGTLVPVSLVYRKGTSLDGTSPLLLYGYGSYGANMDASFSIARLSLLDRGMIFAIAHIRGGQELGRMWYENGKLLKKKNTFTDFIDVAEFMVEEGYADPNRLYAQGGSAGGLLMGAVVNMRPDLWAGVLAQVPFVDIVTTMLDDSIPLTTNEYDEWGNPNEKEYYEYMLSYSPYDNVEAKDYPDMLVTTGLHDSQVQYWEPAKWVARLRARKTDDNLILLKTNMEAGHGGASGRLKQYRETAFEYAFLLDLAGIASIEPAAN